MVSRFEAASGITNDAVRQWLERIQFHAYNGAWLDQHAERIAQVLRAAINRDEFVVEAANTLILIGPHMLSHQEVGQWLELLRSALRGAYDIHDNTLQGRLYALIGQGYTLSGTVKPARAMYDMAISQAEDNIADRALAEEIRLMAHIGLFRTETYLYTDEFTPEHVAEIRALAEHIDDPMLTAHLYQTLSAAYAHRAELEQALGYGMTALGYWMMRGRPLEIARSAHALSMAYSRDQLLPQAQEAVEFAYQAVQQASNPPYEAIIQQQRGIIASQRGQLADAVRWLEAARDSYRSLGWPQHEATVERSLALSYIPLGEYAKADASLMRAADVWKASPNAYEQAAVASTRGYLAGEQGDAAAAIAHLNEALTLCAAIPEMKARDQLIQSIEDDLAHYGGSANENDPA